MVQRKRPIRVGIYQPVIPEYRVPLFTALHRRPEIKVEVFASKTAPGCPVTPRDNFEFPFHRVKFISLFGGQLAWQSGMRIPSAFKPGDVIVICGNPRYIGNYYLIMSARKLGVGVVWWGIWHYPDAKWWASWIKRRLMQFLPDIILVYSDIEINELLTQGFPSQRLFSTNNTIATHEIEKTKLHWPSGRIQSYMRERGLAHRLTGESVAG